MSRRRLHVVRPGGGDWQVKEAGRSSPVARTNNQDEAIGIARAMAQSNRPSQVVIHRPNGRIREEHTYGDDPEKYPG